MNIEEKLEIHDCPLCDGGALLEEEGGCGRRASRSSEKDCRFMECR